MATQPLLKVKQVAGGHSSIEEKDIKNFDDNDTKEKVKETIVGAPNTLNREFIIGDCRDIASRNKSKIKIKNASGRQEIKLTDNSELKELVIFSQAPTQIAMYFDPKDGILKAVKCNGLMVGQLPAENKQRNIDISVDDGWLNFTTIQIQCNYRMAADVPKLCWSGINYIKLVIEGDEYEGGEYKQPNDYKRFSDRDIYDVYREPITFKGCHLLLKGVLLSNSPILGFQVVDLVQLNETQMFYAFNEEGFDGLQLASNTDQNEILYGGMVGIEDDDVLDALRRLCSLVTRWTKEPSSMILPHFIKIMKKMVYGDLCTIHSVISLMYFMNHVIQCENFESFGMTKKPHEWWHELFEGGPRLKYLVKIRKYFYGLYRISRFAARGVQFPPALDVYKWAYLHPTKLSYLISITTFITQVSLFVIILASLDYTEMNVDHLETIPVTISVFVGILVVILVRKQIVAAFEFHAVFPNSAHKMPMILSYIVNIFIALLIIPTNLLLLAYTEDQFDLVLNSLAILFVLELDEQIVDGSVDEKAAYLNYAQSILFKEYRAIDKQYVDRIGNRWDNWDLIYPINRKNCEIDWNSIPK